ncbi:hypothetical protein [Rhizobium straminoryzae]|uniref:Uncharacterized protein n=1 Tax=Rhizobium straminoryzae TaxID=1387186 RepID=A0A549T397_9HYPH|nr:hypothetical protein [Rhizobium straminoryzae]TRL36355.1 hypothetical protein FNA46_18075 [Rhizobium straminoryzae]
MSDRNETDRRPFPRENDVASVTPSAAPEAPLSATEARQGRRGMPVMVVLGASLVLAMLAWGGVEWWAQTNEPPAEQTATPPAGDNTPVNPDARPPSTP